MTDDRNISVHIYREEFVEKLFDKISVYAKEMNDLLSRFKQKGI